MVTSTVLAELRRIYDADGEVTAEAVLEAARPEGSPLHGHFTWDNDVAAEERRLDQARGLIRRAHVMLLPKGARAEPLRARAYLNLPPSETGGRTGVYKPIEVVAHNSHARVEILEQMRRDIAQLRRKYRMHAAAFEEILRASAAEVDEEEKPA